MSSRALYISMRNIVFNTGNLMKWIFMCFVAVVLSVCASLNLSANREREAMTLRAEANSLDNDKLYEQASAKVNSAIKVYRWSDGVSFELIEAYDDGACIIT